MKFYFPDSQDQISTTFDFTTEEYSPYRVRQRDDSYAHEVLSPPPYDGMLVSKAIVDGSVSGSGKYSEAQRSRLYRYGVRRFFRLPTSVQTLGDCGAFNYVNEELPPYSVAEVADFYEGCGFDAGISVDHVILAYDATEGVETAPQKWIDRREISLRYAEDFLNHCESRGRPFEPLGAAQGWSPESYADSVSRLQQMGYDRIALGGMVPLKTNDILECLTAIKSVRRPKTRLHLLGVTRVDSMSQFEKFGVSSFDSTSPFRQAFMDDRDNYHTPTGHYTALRVPQVDANPSVKRRVLSGELDQRTLVLMERQCLAALRAAGADQSRSPDALRALGQYESLLGGPKSYMDEYARTLSDRPWEKCSCDLCQEHGIQITIFRGTERNKRRGFHNLSVLCGRIHRRPRSREDVA
jgi:hypothetical protein